MRFLYSGFDAISLATGQAIVRALFVIVMAGPEMLQAVRRSSSLSEWLRDLWPHWDSPRALGLLMWLAFVPGSLAYFLQMYGQKAVSAPSAEVCLLHRCIGVFCVPSALEHS